jgi:radical SAM superfamily enzyme YgiQ (UPF0313 family)
MAERRPLVLLNFQLDEMAYMPLGLHYLAGVVDRSPALRRALYTVFVKVTPSLETPAIDRALAAATGGVPAAAVLATLLPWHRESAARALSAARRLWPGAPILAGGPEVANQKDRIFTRYPELTAAVEGEGEGVIERLLSDSDRPRLLKGPAMDLAALPSPLARLDDLAPGEVVCIETVRGCPMGCTYCRWSPGSYRRMELDRVEDELTRVGRRPAAGGLWILDGTFNVELERAKRILELLARHVRCGPVTLFLDLGRVRLDREFVRLSVEAKVAVWSVGMQTLTPQSLKAVARSFCPDLYRGNVDLLRTVPSEKRPILDVDLIYGLPGADHASFAADVARALEPRPEVLHAFQLQVFPDTPLHDECARHGFVLDDDCFVLEHARCSREDMRASHEVALGLHSFYNRLHYFTAAGRPLPLETFHLLAGRGDLTPAQILGAWPTWLRRMTGLLPEAFVKLPGTAQTDLIDRYLGAVDRNTVAAPAPPEAKRHRCD